MPAADVEQSKFLSFVLRHDPAAYDLDMDPSGWVRVDEIIRNAPEKLQLSSGRIRRIVDESPKVRFQLSSDATLIRANQGHSVDVDVELEPAVPPSRLFHGTAHRSLEPIVERGLVPMSRLQVHLSEDRGLARTTGQRHGRPVVLEIDAQRMHEDGHTFLLSRNGVWLTAAVPPAYLRIIDG